MTFDTNVRGTTMPASQMIAVNEITARISAYLAEARRAQILARFACGDAVHALRYSEHPSPCLADLAKSLGVDLSGLLRIARTSERIPASERPELMSLVDAPGAPLSWSHLTLLAMVHGRAQRLRLARAAAMGSMSLTSLRDRVAQENVSRSRRRSL